MMRLRLLIAAVAAASVALTACGGANTDRGSDRTLTLATAVDVNSFAPADSRDAHYVQFYQPVYDSLLRIDPAGDYQPMLATRWSYNEDNTVLSLDLRDDVTFTDGQKFDGAAVRANLEAVKNGTGTSSAAFAALESVTVNSPTSVDLHLSAPDPGLIRQLALPGGMMASPAALGTPALAATPVGSGPYVLDPAGTTKSVQYTYKRNPNYWNPDAFPFDTIVLKPMQDPTARLNAVRSGQVDGAFGDAPNIPTAEGAGLTVTRSPGPGFQGLFIFDREGKIVPELADPRVRQAINYAIDPQAILDTLYTGAGIVTRQMFNPKSDAIDPSLDGAYTYDPQKARQLLAEAGVPDGFRVTIPFSPSIYPNLPPVLEQQLGAVGIRVDWAQIPAQVANDEYLSGKYAMVWYQLQSSDPWQAVNFWGSPDAPWNPLHASDPEITAQIEAVRTAPEAERAAAYHKLAKLYVDKAWFAPAYFPDAVYFTSRDVTVTAQALQIVPSIYNFAPAS